MYNLRDARESNMLTEAEKASIWVPVITFANTEKRDLSLNDEKSHIVIEKMGQFKRSPSDQASLSLH